MKERRERGGRTDALVLRNTDPTRFLPIARAQPDIIGPRKAELKREVRADTVRVRRLRVHPIMQLAKTRRRVLERDRPLRRVLRVLIMNTKTLLVSMTDARRPTHPALDVEYSVAIVDERDLPAREPCHEAAREGVHVREVPAHEEEELHHVERE